MALGQHFHPLLLIEAADMCFSGKNIPLPLAPAFQTVLPKVRPLHYGYSPPRGLDRVSDPSPLLSAEGELQGSLTFYPGISENC